MTSVLMICPQFRPMVGGYERAAERLSTALARRGMRVSLVTFRFQSKWPKTEVGEGFDISRIWCLQQRGFSSLTSIISCARFLMTRGRQYDVWHCHAPAPAVGVAIALALLFRKVIVVKLPSSGVKGLSSAIRTGFLGRLGLMRAMLHRASKIIATTDTVRAEALELGFEPDQVCVIPNGVDTERFKPASPSERDAARRELSIPEDAILALQVCRLDPAKNLFGLLEAWGGLPASVGEISHLAIVGGGPLLVEIGSVASASKFHGRVTVAGGRVDVERWYRASDLYVLSSFYEGLSNSLLEAMSSGLPVVTTEVSGSALVAENVPAGIVVPVGDVKAMSIAIASLLSDRQARMRFGASARERIESAFSIESVAERTEMLYRELLAKR